VVATFCSHQPRQTSRRVVWRFLDVRDAEAVRDLIREVRAPYVLHLAAQSSTAKSFVDADATAAVTFTGSLHTLRAAMASGGCRCFVWAGSAEQYGKVSPQQVPIREEVGFAPCNPYALAKAAVDRWIEVCCPPERLPVVRLRLFPCTGPGQEPTFLCADFARQVAAAERTGAEAVEIRAGNLDVVRDYTDVRDVAAALLAAMTQGEPGQAYNVCSGEGRTPRQVAADLFVASGRSGRLLVDPSKFRPADAPILVGSNEKLREATGWQPRVPWPRTVADLLADWRQRLATLSSVGT